MTKFQTKFQHPRLAGALGTLVALAFSGSASADPFAFFNQPNLAAPSPPAQASAYGTGSPEQQDEEMAPELRRQVVDYRSSEAPGTIIIDTPNTYLYLVLGGGKALRYGIGVGREGFTWSGTKTIERKAEWPDWTPPPEMIGRQPYLPRFVAGGPGNPLGARAMYLQRVDVPHSRHQCPLHHRPAGLLRLHPHGQRRRDRPLQPRPRRHQGHRVADKRPSRRGTALRADRFRAPRPDKSRRHLLAPVRLIARRGGFQTRPYSLWACPDEAACTQERACAASR
jgi:hypothetical protein